MESEETRNAVTAGSPEGEPAAFPAPPDSAEGVAENRAMATPEKRVMEIVEERLASFVAEQGGRERDGLLERFRAENPEFAAASETGLLDRARRANPLLDEVGAYYAHLLDKERLGLAEKIEKATAEAEERLIERFRTKRLAASLGAAPGGPQGEGVDPELAEPEKFGGLKSVIAARLKARRDASGA